MSQFRVGIGNDIHRLVEGRKLILGGVEIPYERGLLGHSDGDSLTHAITDALLGAAALGDIGSYFSDLDPLWAGADSFVFLRHVRAMLEERGFEIVNIDATIMAERPKMAAHIPEMKSKLAEALGIDSSTADFGVKASGTPNSWRSLMCTGCRRAQKGSRTTLRAIGALEWVYCAEKRDAVRGAHVVQPDHRSSAGIELAVFREHAQPIDLARRDAEHHDHAVRSLQPHRVAGGRAELRRKLDGDRHQATPAAANAASNSSSEGAISVTCSVPRTASSVFRPSPVM